MYEEKPMNSKLLEKISALQFINDKRRNNFRRTKNCKNIQIPELIMHRVNFNSDPIDLTALPKISEKLNLFPEAFQNMPISNIHLKEMQRL
jgi:hypothetical protein